MRAPGLLVLPLVLSGASAFGDTYQVPADHPTIQAAIVAATAGDTVLVSPGTYVEDLQFLGQDITVRSAAGPAVTTIQGTGNGSVVVIDSGETASTVLEGFTITGGFAANGGGILCIVSSPTIRGNVITGNHAHGGHGGGKGGGIAAFQGSPMIEDNRIVGNTNTFGEGAGVFLGYGTAILTQNVIADNDADIGLGGHGGGVQLVEDASTVRGNTIVGNNASGGGGIRCTDSLADVRDNIVWGNTASYGGVQIDVGGFVSPTVEYNDVQGGFAGAGNITADPLFQNPAAGSYVLTPSSPCIDAGDPASPLDPDGTRADMGARPFGQFVASATVRNGSGLNPLWYGAVVAPALGSSYVGQVDVTGQPGTTASYLFGYETPHAGFFLPAGEVLVNPLSTLYFLDVQVPVGGTATHVVPVPVDYAFSGLVVPTQAVLTGGAPRCCNAVDLLLGL